MKAIPQTTGAVPEVQVKRLSLASTVVFIAVWIPFLFAWPASVQTNEYTFMAIL